MLTEVEILGFIRNFRGAEPAFLNGCCYWFAAILNTRFPQMGYIFYNPVDNHFAWRYMNSYYDATGKCDSVMDAPTDRWYHWHSFCADYPTEAKRIKLDCILKIRR